MTTTTSAPMLRVLAVQEIRNYLIAQGYIEVETPMMQLLHGGAAASR